MNAGRILWFNESKGFGMIHDVEGREIYFHYTSVSDPLVKKTITGGTRVIYDLFQTSIGWEASNVRLEMFE